MKRFLMMIPVILGITFIIFAIMNFTPGDPAKLILGEEATAEDVAKLRTELGLDDPFLVRFARYVINAVQGDFGTSYRNRPPVFNEIFDRFPTTFKVAFFGILIAVFIGVPIERDILAPNIIRISISRPNWSVPNKCAALGVCSLFGMSIVIAFS